MIRRIRIASNHMLAEVCRDKGYPVEYARDASGKENYNTVVVSFPFRYPSNAKLASEMTALDQLHQVRKMQELWSDNSVSCTVYYKPEELSIIKEYLAKNYKNNHKSLSFLLHADHGFAQAPYEEISKERYEELSAQVESIDSLEEAEYESQDECESGACPVK
jgi:hypothetical protein